ncbi:MAG: methylenetetrahydrofolate reductase C-terminal domain-containing protein, partial [Proteobacteria bacterium]|nr:methylenetetrahydrofolate reductase C-terminal domain-containing protein [Pseudomonadota bacterium]
QKGQEMIFERRYDEAMAFFKRVEKLYPHSPIGIFGQMAIYEVSMLEREDFHLQNEFLTAAEEGGKVVKNVMQRYHPPLEEGAPGRIMELPPMIFFAGCVVSPFKTMESEQVWQYVKLLTKIRCGAQFVISQLGFDMKKYAELLRLIRDQHLSTPLIANVFVPTLSVAKIMNSGRVPGVILPDKLLQRMQDEAKGADRGEEARLLRAAKMVAVLRDTGYSGVHLGGNNLSFDSISFLLDKAETFVGTGQQLVEEVHFPEPSTWYLYGNCSRAPRKRNFPILFAANDLLHRQIFCEDGHLFPLAAKISHTAEKSHSLRRFYTFFEHLIKKILFRCRMCGDCTLAESSYLCPQYGCPKRMINGPCGGSNNGFCEVYPNERLCFWVRAYQRGITPDCHHINGLPMLPPKDWSLNTSSSWLNFFSGRDHCRLKSKDRKLKAES